MIASRHNSDGKKAMVRLLDKVVGHFARIKLFIIYSLWSFTHLDTFKDLRRPITRIGSLDLSRFEYKGRGI